MDTSQSKRLVTTLKCVSVCPNPQTSKNQIKVDLVNENFTELRGEIAGPPDTPYEGTVTQLYIYIYISLKCCDLSCLAVFYSFSKVVDISLK